MTIVTLNINGLSTPIKSQWLSEWIKKKTQNLTVGYIQEFPFKYNNIDKVKVNGWKKGVLCLRYV